MNEKNTLRKLRGLTRDRAERMYRLYMNEAMNSSKTRTIGDVRNYIDERMKIYGWTIDMLDPKYVGR